MSTQTIGRYEVKRELGRGGMSTVYHAYDPRFKRDVAIKVLPREMLHDTTFRLRFEREAETIAALEHPAIVPVYDFGEDDGQLYLVMRYMGGGSLSDRLEKGPISLSKTVDVLQRLAPALDKAHGLGVVHRDLKSANILFDEDENGFLSDFGIVKLTETRGMTHTGSMIGTPAYMSPEQARGDPSVDGRSDLYSLGVILFEMLTGELPFEADTPMGIAIKHITDPVPRVLHFQPDLPPRCEAVIMRAMDKEPDNRYQTAEAMISDLMSAVSTDLGGRATMGGLPGDVAARPPDTKELPAVGSEGGARIPLWGWITGGVLAVGVLGFVLFGGSLTGGALINIPPIAVTTVSSTQPPTLTPVASGTQIVLATSTPRAVGPGLGGGSGILIFVGGREGQGLLYSTSLKCVDTPDLCGTGLTQFSRDTTDNRRPSVSPNGKLLLFDARPAVGPARNVYVVNVDGTGQKQLTNSGFTDYSASWSPDGSRILFVSTRNNNPQLYVMKADGSLQLRVTRDRYDDLSPAWSPDGKKILFHSSRNGNPDIYTLDAACLSNLDTCNAAQISLTTDKGNDYNAVWSPDGSKIVFVSERDGNPEIYIMKSDGSGQARLTQSPYADSSPRFSPDGSLIIFSSKRKTIDNPSGLSQIFVMELTGNNVRQVTKIDGANLDPVFVP